MGDNGKEEGILKKACPFLEGKWCIGDACAIWVTISRQGTSQLGTRQVQTEGICSLPALCIIISSKPQPPPQIMKMPPNLLKG